MNDTELLNQVEHVSDIFTRMMLKTMASDSAGTSCEEVTMAQFQAMRHISQHGACTIGSLAEGLSISQPAATMLVDRLARRGLVSRRPGESDRRQAEVTLTPHAVELLGRIESERTERIAAILAEMSPEERSTLVQSMERFIAAALRSKPAVDDACLRCGIEHDPDCIVNQTCLELSGKDMERT